MKNKLVKDLKRYHYSIWDNKRVMRERVIGVIENANTKEENLSRVIRIIDIIMSSEDISDDTKKFIANLDMSVTDINREINEERKLRTASSKKKVAEVSYSCTLKHISDDNSKIAAIFGQETIKDCVYNRIEDLSVIDTMIEKFTANYSKCEQIRNNLMININERPIGNGRNITSENFFDIIKSIEAYLKPRRDIIENAINANEEFVKYFNYLLSEDSIHDDAVKVDRDRLIKFLRYEDYISDYESDVLE